MEQVSTSNALHGHHAGTVSAMMVVPGVKQTNSSARSAVIWAGYSKPWRAHISHQQKGGLAKLLGQAPCVVSMTGKQQPASIQTYSSTRTQVTTVSSTRTSSPLENEGEYFLSSSPVVVTRCVRGFRQRAEEVSVYPCTTVLYCKKKFSA